MFLCSMKNTSQLMPVNIPIPTILIIPIIVIIDAYPDNFAMSFIA